jgi:hypothetical protein
MIKGVHRPSFWKTAVKLGLLFRWPPVILLIPCRDAGEIKEMTREGNFIHRPPKGEACQKAAKR